MSVKIVLCRSRWVPHVNIMYVVLKWMGSHYVCRDHELLKAFREDTRQLQHRKEREKRMKGGKLGMTYRDKHCSLII